ncbi:hypothetical protein FITA111629_15555 [Filibacter tadaridae]|uniref:Uncharacterized protein n=1 Tax=Filibacter tadaridae TaxID=2483811 RepID=A0A3P5XGI0_9BACL|nr:hypothetical protein [Filibacter tadaridae]VDC33901.1 hypothetical protein FILTAD_03078 [Filibacter tadaridae]
MKSEIITVEPYELSEQEIQLVSKTGAGSIEYFKLDGKIDRGEVLTFSVETYKKGKLISDEMKSWGDHNGTYKDVIISFGTSEIRGGDNQLNMMIGVPSGLVRWQQPDKMTMSAMCRMIEEKTTLEKEKPTCLAMWKGTDGDSLSCARSEDGGFPKWLEEADVAYLYKFL